MDDEQAAGAAITATTAAEGQALPQPIDVGLYRERPVLARRRIAQEIAAARARLGWSQAYTSDKLGAGWSLGKYKNHENGRFRLPDPGFIDQLAAIFGDSAGWDADRVEALKQLALEVRDGSWWWTNWEDVFFGDFVGLESDASTICAYAPHSIPGLFQTRDYMAASMRQFPFGDPQTVKRRILARLERQRLLAKPEPPQMHVVLEETVLTRRYGPAGAPRRQLEEIAVLAARPHITVQIIPRRARLHAGAGEFTVLGFGDPEPPAVYVEHEIGGQLADAPEIVERFTAIWGSIRGAALSPGETSDYLKTLIGELDGAEPQ